MPLSDRYIRKIINTKQDSMEFTGIPATGNMIEGQTAIQKKSNSQLAIYRKKFGKIWKSYMSSNGDQYVDRTLHTRILKYTNKFIDYRVFIHNFDTDIGTTEYYLPWTIGRVGTTAEDEVVGFLTPFNMTLHKMIFRLERVNDGTGDISIRLKRMDSGDDTLDTIATAPYESTISANTNFEVNESDFDTSPFLSSGVVGHISVQTDADISSSSSGGVNDWWVTSVWRVEVEI